MPVILARQRVRQEDCKLKISRGYTGNPCFKSPTRPSFLWFPFTVKLSTTCLYLPVLQARSPIHLHHLEEPLVSVSRFVLKPSVHKWRYTWCHFGSLISMLMQGIWDQLMLNPQASSYHCRDEFLCVDVPESADPLTSQSGTIVS